MVNNRSRISTEKDTKRSIMLRCTPLMHTRIVLAAREARVSVNKYLLRQIEKDLPYAKLAVPTEPPRTDNDQGDDYPDPQWDERGKQHQSPG